MSSVENKEKAALWLTFIGGVTVFMYATVNAFGSDDSFSVFAYVYLVVYSLVVLALVAAYAFIRVAFALVSRELTADQKRESRRRFGRVSIVLIGVALAYLAIDAFNQWYY
jgi:hypothetical protein